jgi:beta-phosphoglucomutase-like phosphatase (HAD superfamily)
MGTRASPFHEAIFAEIWPELDAGTHITMAEEKEARFRELAGSKLERLPGLTELLQWVDDNGIRKVAVTNAPRLNAEMMMTVRPDE